MSRQTITKFGECVFKSKEAIVPAAFVVEDMHSIQSPDMVTINQCFSKRIRMSIKATFVFVDARLYFRHLILNCNIVTLLT